MATKRRKREIPEYVRARLALRSSGVTQPVTLKKNRGTRRVRRISAIKESWS